MLIVNKYNLEIYNIVREIKLEVSQGYQILKAGIDPETQSLTLWVLENPSRMKIPITILVTVPNQPLQYHSHDLLHIDTIFENIPGQNLDFVYHVFQVDI